MQSVDGKYVKPIMYICGGAFLLFIANYFAGWAISVIINIVNTFILLHVVMFIFGFLHDYVNPLIFKKRRVQSIQNSDFTS